MKKIFAITIMKFKELVRNFKSSAIVFFLPIVFMGIFGIAFGSSATNITFKVGVIKDLNANELLTFTNVLKNLKTDNSKTKLFEIVEFKTEEEATSAIKESKISGIIKFINGKLELVTNPTDQQSFILSNILTNIVLEENNVSLGNFINLSSVEIPNSKNNDFSIFQFQAAALIIYGILILIPQVAFDFVKINTKKDIFRYFTSKVSGLEIITGHFIYLMIVGFIQLFILYITSIIFGFKPVGDSILALLLIGLPTVSFAIGIGMLIGAFSKNSDAATNLGSVLSIILGFLSGSFINNVDQLFKINLGDLSFSISQLIPSYYASEALRKVMLFGNNINSIVPEFLIIILISGVIFILSAITFNKRQLKKLY